MGKNRSTKELILSKNQRLNFDKKKKNLFNFTKVKNFTSDFVKFYTFNAGFKKKHDDLLIGVFNKPSSVAVVYSKTSTPSAPIIWDKKNNKGYCKVLIVNSGNANAFTGQKGIKKIDTYVKSAIKELNGSKQNILVSSTGVIGEQLDEKKISNSLTLVKKSKDKDLLSAANAIMTTDTFSKTSMRVLNLGSEKIRIFGFAKGSGMIAPKMGTMLAYIFIEANISRNILKKLLHSNIDESFNSISVDSDTSTSDTLMLFSLSKAKQKKIQNKNEIKKISKSLKEIMFELALQVVSDGEGITKLMEINISGAFSKNQASIIGFSIANSPLVKTAIAGEDANWGRVIMAIGKTNSNVNQDKIKLKFGNILITSDGQVVKNLDSKKLDSYMKNKTIQINVNLGLGKYKRTIYASDLTHEYIKINADYRS